MGESANSCRKEQPVVFSHLEWECGVVAACATLFSWISWFVSTINISVCWCDYQRIGCFFHHMVWILPNIVFSIIWCEYYQTLFSPSYGVNGSPSRLFLYPVVWMCLPCGMNMSTKSQDVVWLCLPNLMMRYECVYQVLWCNNNNCISNVPSPSMTTCVGLKALYMKQQYTI